jgi:hypothetical protein
MIAFTAGQRGLRGGGEDSCSNMSDYVRGSWTHSPVHIGRRSLHAFVAMP